MEQMLSEQRGFAFMDEAVPPEMAPMERVAEFETEVDAINYSLDQIMRQRGGLTQMQLADDMKITRAVMTKIKQGQAARPVSKFIAFVEHTRSFALIQFYAMRLGLVVRTRAADQDIQRELARLRSENADVKEKFQRVVGE